MIKPTTSSWLPILVSLVSLLMMLGGLFYYAGQISQHVIDLEKLERQTERRVEDIGVDIRTIAERVARIEGYLLKDGDYPAAMTR